MPTVVLFPHLSRWMIFVLFLLAAGPIAASAAPRKPNVIFFLVDDMGWTDLGVMGSDTYETPNIDRLAARGMRFTNAYSACTVCSPSRAAIMTGKYPARLHVTDWIHGHARPFARLNIPVWTEYLPSAEVTVAEMLGRTGYASASIGKWHLGDEPENFPDHQGFDENIAGYGKGSPPRYFAPYNIPTLPDGPNGEYLTDRLAVEACRFIETHRDKPFFLYLPHYAVHTPLQAKPELVEHYRQKISAASRHNNPVYAAMVDSLDRAVGRVLATVEKAGIADDTVVFFTSDNGGLTIGANPSTSNEPLRAGKGSTYEGGVRVPLIVSWPGTTKAGSVCDEPVIGVDYLPTITEIAGMASGAAGPSDGLSLVPLLRDSQAKLARDAIYWHYPHYHPGGATPYGAIRARDWKLVELYQDRHVELYNVAEDIGETRERSRDFPQRAAALRAQLAEWRKAVGAQMPHPNPQYDADLDARPRGNKAKPAGA